MAGGIVSSSPTNDVEFLFTGGAWQGSYRVVILIARWTERVDDKRAKKVSV